MKYLRLLILTLLAGLSGCIYANVRAPFDSDLNKTELGTKVGRASSQSILWLVAWGDEGIQAAAKNGNLSVINHADQEIFSVLFGAYTKHTIIVYGD
jgi:hypothetical protein